MTFVENILGRMFLAKLFVLPVLGQMFLAKFCFASFGSNVFGQILFCQFWVKCFWPNIVLPVLGQICLLTYVSNIGKLFKSINFVKKLF